eukprot:Polyplicarium_translucidae@DN3025_c0_g1_i11.p2
MNNESPGAWYQALPGATRAMITAVFAVSLLSTVDILPVQYLHLDLRLVLHKFHLWRLLTDYLILGRFSFSWLFSAYLFVSYSARLESSDAFKQRQGGYLFFLAFQMLMLDALSTVFFWPTGRPFLFHALLFAVIYYGCRREPAQPVNIYGFVMSAYQFPFALMLLHFLMGNDIIVDLLGLASGHTYFYLREVMPIEMPHLDFLSTPPEIFARLEAALTSMDFSQLRRPAREGAAAPRQPAAEPREPGRPPETQFGGAGHRLGGDPSRRGDGLRGRYVE